MTSQNENSLDQPCSDDHLLSLSMHISRWKDMAPYLGLTEPEEEIIVEYAPNSIKRQRHLMLKMWKEKHGNAATYAKLVTVFKCCGRQDLSDKISELVASEDGSNKTTQQSAAMLPSTSQTQTHESATLMQHDLLSLHCPQLTDTIPVRSAQMHTLQYPRGFSTSSCAYPQNNLPGFHNFQQDPFPSYFQQLRLGSQCHCSHAPTSASEKNSRTIVPSSQNPLSTSLQRYAKYLKNVYSKKTTPVYDKEHSLLKFKAKSFVNIALVHKDSGRCMTVGDKNEMLMNKLYGQIDTIQKKKTKLYISDVCKCENGSLARSVLLEGAPGVGKTTFAYEFCKQWARGEIGQEWEVVVIIKLRDQRARTAESLHDLLYYPDPIIQQKIVDKLIDQDGEGMLMILDGYDELSDTQKQFNSIVQQLMSKQLFPQATLMVTSRPLATRTLHSEFQQSIDQHIEVLGFTVKNIEEYINSACGDKPELVEDFKSYLSSHPFSSSLMFNPLHCAIVTDLYCSHWEYGDKGFAPKTLTELYTGLVHTLLLRYLTLHPVHKDKDWKIPDLSDLPKDVNQHLKAITKLAVEGIKEQQYIFEEKEDNIPSDTLGMMQREEDVIAGIGKSASYCFLHLTLQEYFTAIHYSDQPGSLKSLLLAEQNPFSIKSFLKLYGKKNEILTYVHWPVALFIAGRTKLSGIPANLLQVGLHHNDREHVTYVNASLLHLLYETQCPELIRSTLVTNEQYMSVSGRSSLDWFVIGYCIANSDSRWQVKKLINKKFDDGDIHKFAMGLNLAKETTGKIISLHIADKSWDKICKILEWLKPHTKTVVELKLVGRKNSKPTTEEHVPLLYPTLESLEVEHADITSPPSILNIVPWLQNCLCTLSLKECDLDSDATNSLICFLLSPQCRIQDLRLIQCIATISDYTGTSYKLKLVLHDTWSDGTFYDDYSDSCLVISYKSWSQPHHFYELKQISVTVDDSSAAPSVINVVKSQYFMLETLKIYVKMLNSESTHVHECMFILKKVDSKEYFLFITASVGDLSQILQLKFSKEISEMIIGCTSHLLLDLIFLQCPMLETLKISREYLLVNDFMLLYEPLYIYTHSEHIFSYGPLCLKNLHTLSLKHCCLSSEVTASIIHCLRIPQSQLCKLKLDECSIVFPDDSKKLVVFNLKFKLSDKKVLLHVRGPCHLIACILLQFASLHKTMTEIKIDAYSNSKLNTPNGMNYRAFPNWSDLTIMLSDYSMLNNLQVQTSRNYMALQSPLPISFKLNFSQQENRLLTLNLNNLTLTSETVNSLVQFLQSPHCRLCKVALYKCKIPKLYITDLVKAIVSSTEIKNLLIDQFIDSTSSLTALSSSLMENKTLKKLTIFSRIFDTILTDEFKTLVKGIDSSAVEKLGLSLQYMMTFRANPLSRHDVKIDWYDNTQDLLRNW